jgi:acyl CoA:acetate/3-ketoacid CoA transferase beta subunit
VDKVLDSPAEAIADLGDGLGCVDVVVTDLAVLRRAGQEGGFAGFTVESLAPGFTSEEVMELTEFDLRT